MSPIRPTRLRPGDKVALASVSSPVPSPEAVDTMVACLADLGLRVVVAEHVSARDGYLAGSDALRLADFNQALRAPDVKAIFFAWGGKGGNHLLPYLDYYAFQQTPKIVVGLSDPSCIINALTVKTDVVTFHGPTGVNFAEPTGLPAYTRESMLRALFEATPLGDLPAYSEWQILRPGRGTGRLVGGHLSTIQTLLGTPFEPRWDQSIFFWEEVGRQPKTIDLSLWHFRLAGVFDRIAGMVVGRPLDCADPTYDTEMDLKRTILEASRDYEFPILFNVDLGHADPKLTLPLGITAELELRMNTLRFAIIESGVE